MHSWEPVGGLEMLGGDVDELGRSVEGSVSKGLLVLLALEINST